MFAHVRLQSELTYVWLSVDQENSLHMRSNTVNSELKSFDIKEYCKFTLCGLGWLVVQEFILCLIAYRPKKPHLACEIKKNDTVEFTEKQTRKKQWKW